MSKWLADYIEYRKDFYNSDAYAEEIKLMVIDNKGDYFLYNIVQPTGLIYGCPIQLPFHTAFNNHFLSENNELAIILFDCFVHCYIVNHFKKSNQILFDAEKILDDIIFFYQLVAPKLTLTIKESGILISDPYEYTEYILEKYTEIDDLFVENNFTRYFFNSLLFVDLIFYEKYLRLGTGNLIENYENSLSVLLKIIVSASHSNYNKFNKGEKLLFENLTRITKLTEQIENETISFINNKIPYDEIIFSYIDSYCLKKLCYELSFLMIMTDKIVNESEQLFLEKLSYSLNISTTEKSQSIESVQNFICRIWDNRIIYDNNINFLNFHKGLFKKISCIIKNNKARLLNEVYESKELVELLSKSTIQELTKDEKTKVKEQLMDILKSIPAFAIFLLPGGALLLPILMKIIPQHMMLPSSFQNKK